MNSAPTGPAVGPTDGDAVSATAFDYIEGWYAGDAERMERAVHRLASRRS